MFVVLLHRRYGRMFLKEHRLLTNYNVSQNYHSMTVLRRFLDPPYARNGRKFSPWFAKNANPNSPHYDCVSHESLGTWNPFRDWIHNTNSWYCHHFPICSATSFPMLLPEETSPCFFIILVDDGISSPVSDSIMQWEQPFEVLECLDGLPDFAYSWRRRDFAPHVDRVIISPLLIEHFSFVRLHLFPWSLSVSAVGWAKTVRAR